MTMLATYSLMHTDGDIFNCHFIWSTLHACINLGRLLVVGYHYMSVNVTDEERHLLRKGGVFDIFKRSEFAVRGVRSRGVRACNSNYKHIEHRF